MYVSFFKRFFDFCLSLVALIVLFPFLLILTAVSSFVMKGNPFFTQLRPGLNEKIFRLIKFRTMTCERDKDGNLLPDEQRLTKYGKFLRSTSLDELPELINILVGDMSIVGPRPLLPEYLPLYNERQRLRHTVRPGLTGLAQINGRNTLTWEEKFEDDIRYIENVSFTKDMKIIFATVGKVLRREGISSESSSTMEMFTGSRENELTHV